MNPCILKGSDYSLPWVQICPGPRGSAKMNEDISGLKEPRLLALRGLLLRQHADREKCVRCRV